MTKEEFMIRVESGSFVGLENKILEMEERLNKLYDDVSNIEELERLGVFKDLDERNFCSYVGIKDLEEEVEKTLLRGFSFGRSDFLEEEWIEVIRAVNIVVDVVIDTGSIEEFHLPYLIISFYHID